MADTNNNKILNVPPLRFPEFTDEWEQQRLNEYLEENKTRNTKGLFYKKDVLSVSGDYGIVNQIDLLGRSFAGVSVANYHVVRKGDIVYTKSPLKEYPYGIVKSNKGADGIVSTLYAVYETKSNTISNFVEYYFALASRTNKYFKPIVRIGAKHDMKIGNDEVLDNFVSFPKLDEQRKISDFLSLIEKRIVLQTKIIEKYKSLIKGIVVEHYNKTHKTKVKIKDLGKSYSVMNMSKEDLSESGNECIIYGELFTTYDCVATDIVSRTEKSIQSSTISTGNDLLFPASTTVDAQSLIAPTAISQPNIILGGDMFGIVVDKKYNNEYLSYIFNYLYKNYLARYAQGSTIIHLYYNDIKNLDIELPDINTQNKLVLLLQNMQYKIHTEKKMLSMLEIQKAYLLSNLFI